MADTVPSQLAAWRPFDDKGTTPLRQDIVCVHTMVGSLAGSWAWANRAGNPYWHFGMAGDGETWQCQDLRYRSAANLEGNPYVIPIETADMGSPFAAWSGSCGDVPAWTGAQVDRLVDLIAWLCVRYDIPPRIISDTQAGRRGLAYHRQGVPSSPEWKTGNLRWSSSTGKCCPDWRRITQFKETVVPRVAAAVTGDEEFHLVDERDKDIMRNIIRQEMYGDDAAHSKGLTPVVRNEVRAVLMEMFPDGYSAAFGAAMQAAVGKIQQKDGKAAAQVRARSKEGSLEALEIAGLYVPPEA